VNGSGTPRSYDLTRDGRFIGIVDPALAQVGNSAVPQIQIVLNWHEELRARVPIK